MNRMTSFEGDTGPYLQYAHARLCSIHRKASAAVADIPSDLTTADFTLLKEPHAVDLVRQLASWPDVFLNTIKTQEPATVLTYLFKMTHAVSSSYDHLQVVGSDRDVMLARLALYSASVRVLNNGMRLLGLNPVERCVSPQLSYLNTCTNSMPIGCKNLCSDVLVDSEPRVYWHHRIMLKNITNRWGNRRFWGCGWHDWGLRSCKNSKGAGFGAVVG